MSPSSKRMAARLAAPATHSTRSAPGRISGIPGIRNTRNSGDAAGMPEEKMRDFDGFAMSAEKESYATRQELASLKMYKLKAKSPTLKTRGWGHPEKRCARKAKRAFASQRTPVSDGT